MPILPITSLKTPVTIPIVAKPMQQQHIFDKSFSDIFTSSKNKDINEIKDLKTKEGNLRFNKKDIKEIKNLKNNNKIDNEVIKQFADTMLDVKSMSEVYLHAKEISAGDNSKTNKEYGIIKNLVKSYELPFKDWTDSIKEDYHTKIERMKINNQPAYKLQDCFEHKTGIYKANGKMVSECTVTAGPYNSSDSDEENNTSSTTYSEQTSKENNPLDPTNPFSPLYW